MDFNPAFAYIECGFCGGKFQAENDELLNQIVQQHWQLCFQDNPYIDPNGYYEGK